MPIKYTTGAPVQHGDIVHIKNHAYTVDHADQKSGYVYVRAMTEGAGFKPVFPSQIGAYWDNVHPLFGEVLSTWRP
jgi:hypothetical protein